MWNNVPINGWPQIKGIENIKDIPDLVSDVSALKTVVGNADSGLVADVSALETVVGNNTGGLVKDVADINSALNPASFIFSGLTYLHATYVEGGYFRIGKLIIVNIRITADLENDGEINIANLPLPMASGYAVVSAIVTTTTGNMVGGYINAAGALVIPEGKVGASYIISSTYVERTASQSREEDQEPADDTKTATIKRSKKS